MERQVKFTGVDTMFNDDVLEGEADENHVITKLRVVDPAYSKMLGNIEARMGREISTLEELSAAMPRLELGWDNEDAEVEKSEEAFRGRVVKMNPDRQQVFGWAYVTHDEQGEIVVDRSGEFIEDVEVLEKAAYDFVTSSRKGGADHAREADEVIVKSTMIESIVFTPEKIKEMGIPSGTIPQGAWWVGFQIHDQDIWKSYRDGRRTSFSIHGRGIKKKV